MSIKKKFKAKVATRAKAVSKSKAASRSKAVQESRSDPKAKTRPMAGVLHQAKGVQGKVKKAAVSLGGVNKVLKEETKTAAPAAAVVDAVEKSAEVEAKVKEAAAELVVVNEALTAESEARAMIEEELLHSQEDLAASRAQEKRARHQLLHDPVTGLPNAALFRDRLKSALAQARRQSWRLAVMFIDLDGFKQINDTHGHDAGDALLRLVGERLAGFVREGDTVSRRSGDEFLFLMLEAKDEDNARAMAERIIDVISVPALIAGAELSVSASVGIAMFPGDGTTAAALLKKADIAMYEAKGRSNRR